MTEVANRHQTVTLEHKCVCQEDVKGKSEKIVRESCSSVAEKSARAAHANVGRTRPSGILDPYVGNQAGSLGRVIIP